MYRTLTTAMTDLHLMNKRFAMACFLVLHQDLHLQQSPRLPRCVTHQRQAHRKLVLYCEPHSTILYLLSTLFTYNSDSQQLILNIIITSFTFNSWTILKTANSLIA